jgi:hypothetical protein
VGRLARPRRGWGHRAPRARRPTRPLRQGPSPQHASHPRQTGGPSRSWRRLTRGGWLSVLGAGPSGPATRFSPIVPPVDAQACRHDGPPGRAPFRPPGQEVVLGVERSGSQRAPTRAAPLAPSQGQGRCHGCPAPGGHPRKPIAGCGRVRKDASGAGRCLPARPPLSQRTRHVRMAPQERPIDALHW